MFVEDDTSQLDLNAFLTVRKIKLFLFRAQILFLT